MNRDKPQQLSEKTKLSTHMPWIHFIYILLNQIHFDHGQFHPVPVKKETLINHGTHNNLNSNKKDALKAVLSPQQQTCIHYLYVV
jgi:hypothetical protein